MSSNIQYQAAFGQFNAMCESPFVAMERENFPDGSLLNVKTCLVPIGAHHSGTATPTDHNPIQYVALSPFFDARCVSPFVPLDAVKFPDSAHVNWAPDLKPKV